MNETSRAADAEEPLAGPLLRQIGTHLRHAREERRLSVAEVASVLRIRRAYLHNLEEGELAQIPGRAYALGFLRTYADYLDFDGEAIVAEVKRTNEQLPENPQLHVREPLPESQRPPLLLVGISVLLAALLYTGWTLWQRDGGETLDIAQGFIDPLPETLEPTGAAPAHDEPSASSVPDLPALPAIPTPPVERIDDLTVDAADFVPAAAAPEGADATVDAILEGTAAERDEADAVDIVAVDDVALEPASTGAARTDTTDEPAAASPETLLALIETESGGVTPQAYGDDVGTGRVVLVATAPTWVRVRSADQDFEWTRTMEQGDAFFVHDRDDLALWTGNAGGLKVILDGEAHPALGQSGEVRRDIPLAVDSLRAQYAEN